MGRAVSTRRMNQLLLQIQTILTTFDVILFFLKKKKMELLYLYESPVSFLQFEVLEDIFCGVIKSNI